MAESYTICGSSSNRPVRKLSDTPSYFDAAKANPRHRWPDITKMYIREVGVFELDSTSSREISWPVDWLSSYQIWPCSAELEENSEYFYTLSSRMLKIVHAASEFRRYSDRILSIEHVTKANSRDCWRSSRIQETVNVIKTNCRDRAVKAANHNFAHCTSYVANANSVDCTLRTVEHEWPVCLLSLRCLGVFWNVFASYSWSVHKSPSLKIKERAANLFY